MTPSKPAILTTRLTLALVSLASGTGWVLYCLRVYRANLLFASRARQLIAAAWAGLLLVLLVGIILALTRPERLLSFTRRLLAAILARPVLLLLAYGVTAGLYTFLLLGPYGNDFSRLAIRLGLFVPLVLLGTLLLKAAWPQRGWAVAAGAALLLGAAFYRMFANAGEASTYPFTLYWSEASRFYYASLYFSERLYDQVVAPTVLHPSRYLMQAIPFILPGAPLWLHRLWQGLLWVATSGLTACLFSRRLRLADRQVGMMTAAWMFMFLFIGPVYYHLQVPVILLLGWFNARRPWRSLGIILAASAWAGISRINWFPLPALLGVTLYLLEKPKGKEALLRYLVWPAIWSLSGVLAAFGAQSAYALLSGNPVEQFTSSFSSALLWYRLWPNPTYPLGILPGAILISLPFGSLIGLSLAGRGGKLHPIRSLGVTGILMVFFAGGLLVSTKIGGGSNLHNLDAYLVLLAVASAYAFFGRIQLEPDGQEELRETRPGILLGAALTVVALLPVYYSVSFGSPLDIPDRATTQTALEKLTKSVRSDLAPGDEVLFLAERQLITFDYLSEIDLVPDYERVFLMEMVMGDNQPYLERFHEDLRQQRYAMIISEPLFTRLKGREEAFGEENDVWVQQVSEPVLCYYKPFKTLREVKVQLLVPRTKPGTCAF